MPETRLEELVDESCFVADLSTQSESFFRLSRRLLGVSGASQLWNKRLYFQLISEADSLECYLDDFGARYNQTYAGFRELVGSLRWFAYSGFSISHLLGRFRSYGEALWNSSEARDGAKDQILGGLDFLQSTSSTLIHELIREGDALGLHVSEEPASEESFLPVEVQRKLPRNVGQEPLIEEDQKIAEVASKFIQAANVLGQLGLKRTWNDADLHRFVELNCTEAKARVYQASVHNLQSTYDTHLQNTVLEHQDERLARLRGHASIALHLLQAVTYLSHFIERHSGEAQTADPNHPTTTLIKRSDVERVTVDVFLTWAQRMLQNGVSLAEDLLPAYSKQEVLEVRPANGLRLHARPASLLVSVVNHWGTPVEMEVSGQRCNAASILELLVTIGSHSDPAVLLFHGDERPLRDIDLLFAHGLGEKGLASLPAELGYLRESS